MRRTFSKRPATDPLTGEAPAPLTAEQVWSRMLGWQTRREHSRAELSARLADLGVAPELAEQSLARLDALGLQSDDRCAESLIRSQMARGRGERAIRQVLQRRGLAPDHEALVTLSVDTDWSARARELLQRRFGPGTAGDARDRARRVRFLQYRGFSLSQALSALGRDAEDEAMDPGETS